MLLHPRQSWNGWSIAYGCTVTWFRLYVRADVLRSYVFLSATCVFICSDTAVWVVPECGGIARCGAAWESETAGNKVNDGALTMPYELYIAQSLCVR